MAAKDILTLLVIYDDATVQPHFGIWHEGRLWLVTEWLVNKSTQVATPMRMIRIDEVPRRNDPGDRFDYEGIRLPRAVIEGLTEDTPGYEVRSLPSSPRVRRRDLKTLPTLF